MHKYLNMNKYKCIKNIKLKKTISQNFKYRKVKKNIKQILKI